MEELKGRNLEEEGFEPLYPRTRFKELMERDGQVVGLEAAWTRRDGSTIWARESARAVRDSGGRTLFYEGTVEDLTERKLAEQALRESEEKYRNLVERANDGIIIIQDSIVLFANTRAAEIWGGTRDELIGTSFASHVDPSELSKVAEHYRKRMVGVDVPPVYETVLKRKDGRRVYAELNAGRIDFRGKPADLVIIRDISERKEAERIRALLATGIEDLSEIVILADSKLNIQYINKAVETVAGHSKERALGSTLKEIFPTNDKSLANAVRQVFRHGRAWKGRVDFEKAGGSQYAAEATVSPVQERSGTVSSCALVIRDITQEEKVKERLIRSEKMESLGTLAGGIAHDFNNILSSVLGYAELVMDDIPKGTLPHSNLEQVLLAGKRGKDLVKQILAFSRQEKQERAPVQVQRVAEETAKLLRASIPSTVEMRLDLRSNGIVSANPTQISQVLMNLCTNAVQAMEDRGGILEVGLEEAELDEEFVQGHPNLRRGAHLRLTVSDTGHGIDPAILGRIFDPFFTTKEKGKGTGMGLPVAHGIVKSLGGEITVYSKPGKGTTVNVYLPVCGGTQQVEVKEEAPILGGKERILFVDDEAHIVGIGKQILGRLGYEVVTNTSPLEALEAFRARPDRFDLVITDMTMPNMTGDILAAKLKHIRPDIPVILCTGFSERITKENAELLTIEEYLMKPLLKKDMAEAVRRALDKVRTKE
jgi:PAS domain S-box-containing protein